MYIITVLYASKSLLFEHCFIGIIANIGERQYRFPRTNSCELHHCLCLITRFVCIWAKGHLRWRQGMVHMMWSHRVTVAYVRYLMQISYGVYKLCSSPMVTNFCHRAKGHIYVCGYTSRYCITYYEASIQGEAC